MAKKKTKAAEEDRLERSFSMTMEGVDFDSMVERARLNAARHFMVPTARIWVKGINYRVGQTTPFQQTVDTPVAPETWLLDVRVGVKEEEEKDDND